MTPRILSVEGDCSLSGKHPHLCIPARRRQYSTTGDRRVLSLFSMGSYARVDVHYHVRSENQQNEAIQQQQQEDRFINICNILFDIMNLLLCKVYIQVYT